MSAGGGGGGGGSSGAAHDHRHATLSPHFCSCESFFFDVVGRGEKPACKHLIAAQLAEALAEKAEKEAFLKRQQGGGEGGRKGQQQLPSSPSSVSPLAAFAPAPTLVPDDVLARLLIAG